MASVALEQAIMAACDAHYGQTDRAGQPYILHPLRVMAKMTTETERIAAVLHDAAEDSDAWDVERVWVEFGRDVGAAVDALTKRDGEEYDAYLGRVEENPVARKVKLADLQDNSDMTRLARATDKDWERYRKYQLAISRLTIPSPQQQEMK
jgi:guanosine-3',5'-bis(diphosphate) 3'-pyrophosphohydrolase